VNHKRDNRSLAQLDNVIAYFQNVNNKHCRCNNDTINKGERLFREWLLLLYMPQISDLVSICTLIQHQITDLEKITSVVNRSGMLIVLACKVMKFRICFTYVNFCNSSYIMALCCSCVNKN